MLALPKPSSVISNSTKKRLIIFVHGFFSGFTECWGPLAKLLESDSEIEQDFNMSWFEYRTSLISFGVHAEIPSLQDVATEFSNFLEGNQFLERYSEITLVAHSLGGLVIQFFLAKMLQEKKGESLKAIRQVILYVTPNLGSTFLVGFRSKLLSKILRNPQEEALRVFSEEVTVVQQIIKKDIIMAPFRGQACYPIPFYCFYGNNDSFVSMASAAGHFVNVEGLPGDHSSVKEPRNCNDERYKRFKKLLQNPAGHIHFFEVDIYEADLEITPFSQPIERVIRHSGERRVIKTDNEARLKRTVTFSKNNICQDLFQLRYTTLEDGLIVPTLSHENEADPGDQSDFHHHGNTYKFHFHPNNDEPYFLDLKMYKAFDEGNRDVHFHFDGKSFIKRYQFKLSLKPFLDAGYKLVAAPKLYFDSNAPNNHAECDQRVLKNPEPYKEDAPLGIWKWELENVTTGVVDISLNGLLQKNTHNSSYSGGFVNQQVTLSPNKVAVFGYGSLISIASLERTLQRHYDGPFIVCNLEGWQRTWDVAMPNTTSYTETPQGRLYPKNILYLNLRPRSHSQLVGVLFVVSPRELNELDKREWIYKRQIITHALRGVVLSRGEAYTYIAKPEYIMVKVKSPAIAAARSTYLDILETGFKELGDSFRKGYTQSSDPVPKHLVIQDLRDEHK